MKKPKVHYVDNQALYAAIVKHRKEVAAAVVKGEEPPRIPEFVGECIFKIANKLSILPKFVNYSFRDEMVADAIENCFLYYYDYDPDRADPETGEITANPFAYYTQIAFFAFIRRINREEKIRYSAYKSFYFNVVHGNVGSHDTMMLFDDGEKNLLPATMYDNIAASMSRFEKKEADRKLKREQKKQGLQKFYKDE